MLAWLFEQRHQPFDFRDGILVDFSRIRRVVEKRVDQNGDGLRHAVENEQLIGDEENHRGRAQFVLGRARHNRLDIMNEFVSDEADRAAGEPWQTGQGNARDIFSSSVRQQPGRPCQRPVRPDEQRALSIEFTFPFSMTSTRSPVCLMTARGLQPTNE